ncbi:hypothetical protein EVAR_3025_1 [Eumeta japonica]|uniref:Histone-lysine N-methyltransferase SETMAR n=1 Tax=Eumeta variegata TaxID=151549 RepID=A0A4C1STR2_EUMVA|nr:hypothetical protein EVAR_3025_1 [Eumeta japonica]
MAAPRRGALRSPEQFEPGPFQNEGNAFTQPPRLGSDNDASFVGKNEHAGHQIIGVAVTHGHSQPQRSHHCVEGLLSRNRTFYEEGNLQDTLGANTPPYGTVASWSAESKRERTSIKDGPPSGGPTTLVTNKMVKKSCHGHRSAITMAAIRDVGFEIFVHLPYSPDRAPNNFYIFPRLKEYLKRQRLVGDEAAFAIVQTSLRIQIHCVYVFAGLVDQQTRSRAIRLAHKTHVGTREKNSVANYLYDLVLKPVRRVYFSTSPVRAMAARPKRRCADSMAHMHTNDHVGSQPSRWRTSREVNEQASYQSRWSPSSMDTPNSSGITHWIENNRGRLVLTCVFCECVLLHRSSRPIFELQLNWPQSSTTVLWLHHNIWESRVGQVAIVGGPPTELMVKLRSSLTMLTLAEMLLHAPRLRLRAFQDSDLVHNARLLAQLRPAA